MVKRLNFRLEEMDELFFFDFLLMDIILLLSFEDFVELWDYEVLDVVVDVGFIWVLFVVCNLVLRRFFILEDYVYVMFIEGV